MSMQSIRDRYEVPAKRGARIALQGRPGTITGAARYAEHLTVRFDDDPKQTCYVHPRWEVEYLDAPAPEPAPAVDPSEWLIHAVADALRNDPGTGTVSERATRIAAHITPQVDAREDHVRCGAANEVRRYIQRLYPEGLISKKSVIADIEIGIDRLARGICVNGSDRRR